MISLTIPSTFGWFLPLLRSLCSFEQNIAIYDLVVMYGCQFDHSFPGGDVRRPFLQNDTVIGIFRVYWSHEHLVPSKLG
jgi:hypothetical protein